MELKDYLTNELISKRFDNQFDLVNYAIRVAEDMIHAGRGPRVKTETENPALQVLEEIVSGKDTFEDEGSEKEGHSFQETLEESVEEENQGQKTTDTTNEGNSEKETVLTE